MNKDLSDRQQKIISYYKDTLEHKKLVIESALKLANYLFENDFGLGLQLLDRANLHDNSKLVGYEIEKMSGLFGNSDSFTNPSLQLAPNEYDIIKEHWSKNRHHPEYFECYDDMAEIDIVEMVCDWYARSIQYNTDFLDFVNTRQNNRFHFSDKLFKKIYFYCEIIAKEEG